MNREEVLERLRLGLERVKVGWTQGRFFEVKNGVPCYCATGAISDPGGSPGTAFGCDAVYFRCVDAIVRTIGCSSIPTWNDEAWRTQAEVVDLFVRTIARLENEEVMA